MRAKLWGRGGAVALIVSAFFAVVADDALFALDPQSGAESTPLDSRGGAPSTLVLSEDFEIPSNLDDPAVQKIVDDWPAYLEKEWLQDLDGYARSVRFGLERGGVFTEESGRHLSILLSGEDGRLIGPTFRIDPRLELDLAVNVRSGTIGDGRVEVGVRFDNGTFESLVTVDGPTGWSQRRGRTVVPEGVREARVEIRVFGDPVIPKSTLELDDLVLSTTPKILLDWIGSLRRLSLSDDRPLHVRSVGLPDGEYRVVFTVFDDLGVEHLRIERPRYVTSDLPIDFLPHLEWSRYDVPRGLYTVRMDVIHSESGWVLSDEREFALAGRSPFAGSDAIRKFGVVIDPVGADPAWLKILGEVRVAARFDGQAKNLLEGVGEFRRAIVLDENSTVDEETAKALAKRAREWFWFGDTESIVEQLESWQDALSFVRIVFENGQSPLTRKGDRAVRPTRFEHEDPRLLVGGGAQSGRETVFLDPRRFGADPASRLASLLYATWRPATESVFVDDAQSLFFRRVASDVLIPKRELLAWEFVTGFLSRARFVDHQQPNADSAVRIRFERNGETFIAFIPSPSRSIEPIELWAAGDTLEIFDAVGTPRTVRAGSDRRARFELRRTPLLVRGIDVDRARILQSFEAAPVVVQPNGERSALRLRFENPYPYKIDAQISLQLPEGWSDAPVVAPVAVAPGASVTIEFPIEVPEWYGSSTERGCSAQIRTRPFRTRSQPESNSWTETPIEFDVDLQSRYFAIRIDSIDSATRITVQNVSGERLRASVYAELQPTFIDRRWPRDEWTVGESKTYEVIPSDRDGNLYIAVTLDQGTVVNRNFSLAAR